VIIFFSHSHNFTVGTRYQSSTGCVTVGRTAMHPRFSRYRENHIMLAADGGLVTKSSFGSKVSPPLARHQHQSMSIHR